MARYPRTFPSNEAQDLAEAVGFHGLLTPTNKDVLLEASIAYRTSVSNRAQIQAFMKGLDETGVLSVLRGQSGKHNHLIFIILSFIYVCDKRITLFCGKHNENREH